ncbi:hypothetical protein OF83DRAFT_540170 [Amylostereum chailletii]|nr:hypothetical protein OF83DRAFT_540170 [Amylostereum chailletii]
MPQGQHGTKHALLGGKSAITLFVCVLLAFVAESQLTQYVQSNLGYRQPFFIFYIVHSAFALSLPLHLLFLVLRDRISAKAYIHGLAFAFKSHLAPSHRNAIPVAQTSFPTRAFVRIIALLTIGYTLPGLLWFTSITLSSVSDVTAIWNTNAFFAYLITVKLYKMEWERRKLSAVVLATLGVLAVVYGGSQNTVPPGNENVDVRAKAGTYNAPLIGDMLTLIASFAYGLYQVLYKRYVALSSDPESEFGEEYDRLSISSDDSLHEAGAVVVEETLSDAVYPPPFGLYADALTSCIGLATFAALWIFLPILDYTGYEPFRLPPDLLTTFSIAGVAATGLVFNAGLMALLGLWGPIVVSVGNLLTIVLVFISDIVLGHANVITVWSLTGAGSIIVAFGILVLDMLRR